MTTSRKADPDRVLVRECQQHAARDDRNGAAFARLYERYRRLVYSVCHRYHRNPDDAFDAAQATFETLLRRIRDFRFESRFSTWVYKVATNTCIDARRSARCRRTESLEELTAPETADDSPRSFADVGQASPDEVAYTHELQAEVHAALERLSTKLRCVVVLRYLRGMSYEEIGAAEKLPIGTVKSRLSRAHETLQECLAPVRLRDSA